MPKALPKVCPNSDTGKSHLTVWIQDIFLVFKPLFFFYLTLQYCICFAIYQNESATGIHVFPILNPPPSSLPISSLWVVPVHQPQASSIMHRTWTGHSFHIWYYTYFNVILPNNPTLSLSHRVQRLFYTSVSLLLSRIQGYCYFRLMSKQLLEHGFKSLQFLLSPFYVKDDTKEIVSVYSSYTSLCVEIYIAQIGKIFNRWIEVRDIYLNWSLW